MESNSTTPTLHEAVKALIGACKAICDKKPQDKAKIFKKELSLFDALCEKLNTAAIAKMFDEAETSIGGRLHISFMEHALVDKQFSIVAKGPSGKRIILRFCVFLEEALNVAANEYSKMMIDDYPALHIHRELMIKLLTVYSIYKEDATDYINAIKIYTYMMDTESIDQGGGPDFSQLLGPNGILSPDTMQKLISALNKAASNGMKDDNGNPIDIKQIIQECVPADILPPMFVEVIANTIPKLVGQMRDGELDQDSQRKYMEEMQMQFQNMMSRQ